MNEKIRSTTRFRQLLRQDGFIPAPGCHDALGAKIIEKAGFPVVYMSGNATSATRIGSPDIGLLGLAEMVANARGICYGVEIPVICDADTGYGNLNNVIRTVREFEAAGVAGIHIEDQLTPKKCGAMPGLQLVSLDEALAKIKAALNARSDPDFVIIARTDARRAYDWEEAVTRAKAFAEAGVDMVYVEGLTCEDEVKQLPKKLPGVPLMLDVLETWPWTNQPIDKLSEWGYKMAIYPLTATLLFARIMEEMLQELKQAGCTRNLVPRLMDLKEYEELLGLEAINSNS